ncbi:hypothetical protein KFE94_07200 [bacterium SCSIO 12643]|nr:hypothetical protein KFE94_07200 [bacterium SCSIO 12643]
MAEVISAADYYAFGSLMPMRNASSDDYRYGFNGMEKDDEVKGTGNSLDFGARIYDPRVGRWLSVDPKAAKYESWSPYHFSANSPILVMDPNGEDWYVVNSEGVYQGEIIVDDQVHGFQVQTDDGVMKRYAFNDQVHDKRFVEENIYQQEQLYGDNGTEPIVHFVSDNYVEKTEEKMSGGEKAWGVRHAYAQIESRGGAMDGINPLMQDFVRGKMSYHHPNQVNGGVYPHDVNFFINTDDNGDKAYNFHDFGNYLWGGAMFKLGFNGDDDLEYILEKANSNATGDYDSDSKEDQQAISDGYNNAKGS